MAREAKPNSVNPLWIISLFLSLTEVTVGVVASLAAGWIQGLLAILCVAFPVAIAAIFFYVLWHRPFVLYAPADYSDETDVASFVEAMTNLSRRKMEKVESVVSATLEEQFTNAPVDGLDGKQIRDKVREALRGAQKEFEDSLVYIDVSEMKPHRPDVKISLDDNMTVQEFMDEIWFALRSEVEPYTYGTSWILEDSKTRERLADVDTDQERSQLNSREWTESLAEFGIMPGARLTVRRIGNGGRESKLWR